MDVSSVRTRLLKRTVDIGSLKIQDVLKFIRAKDNTTEEQHQQRREYLQLILNHFTLGRLAKCAEQLARTGSFSVLEDRQALFRPGELATFYAIIVRGKLGQLRNGECSFYEAGEGVGDEELHLNQQRRQSYVFHCSLEPAIVCTLSYQAYRQIFPEKTLMVERYSDLLAQTELFLGLERDSLTMLLKDAKEIELAKKERLYEPGSLVRGVYLVLEGTLRQTIETEEKKRGDKLPDSLNRIKDFRVYVQSYDVLRENQRVKVETRISYHVGDLIGVTQVFAGQPQRLSIVRSIGPCKLLFLESSSLKRYGGLQVITKQRLFEHRRRSKRQQSRRKTVQSRPVNETVQVGELQFRRLMYARNLH